MKLFNENRNEIIILAILPLLFLYRMVFFCEIVTTNDELERHPINEWRDHYIEKYDDVPQWYPNLFSGMPSYGGYIYTNGEQLSIFPDGKTMVEDKDGNKRVIEDGEYAM